MDALRRSNCVYGKTEAGTSALKSARGALSSSARQLLILIDGRRSFGDLSNIFGEEVLDRSLGLLESHGYVQLIQHAPEANESPMDLRVPTPKEKPAKRVDAVPRRRRATHVVLGALIAITGIIWLLTREETVTQNPEVSAAPVEVPAAPASGGQAPAPTATDAATGAAGSKSPEPLRLPVTAGAQRTPVRPNQGQPAGSTSAPRSVADEHPTAAPSSAPVLHVRDQVMPRIPKLAEELGIDAGRVVVLLHVNPKGTVERVELISATPPQVYDQDMQQAFEKWTFDPPGVPGRMTVQVDLAPHQ